MLALNDGRNELWQWDTGRKLTVDADCSQVHFSNKFFGRSVDVDVVDGTAEIPDVLLQADKDLLVWAFVGTAENGYTKISKIFKVNKRNKPADYVFTPPEQTTLGEIMERLDKIEEIQDPDAIKNAVDEYLANNPIQAEEKDPTVPDWAKRPQKPTYTAEEVGAQPKGDCVLCAEQNLTEAQKAQARENIGAVGADEIDITNQKLTAIESNIDGIETTLQESGVSGAIQYQFTILEESGADVDVELSSDELVELNSTIAALRSLKKSNTAIIAFLTDLHIANATATKIKKAIAGYNKISASVKTDLLLFGGDYLENNPTTTKEQALTLYSYLRDILSYCNDKAPAAVLKGNHDDNTMHTDYINGLIDFETFWAELGNIDDDRTVRNAGNIEDCYGYYDIPNQKVRVFYVNTVDLPQKLIEATNSVNYKGQWDTGISIEQLQFIADNLKFDTSGWHVMVFSHHPIMRDIAIENSCGVQADRGGSALLELLDKFNTTNTSGSISVAGKDFEGAVNYDFTNNQDCKIVACVNGHTHRDSVELYNNSFFCISTRAVYGHPSYDGHISSSAYFVVDRNNNKLHLVYNGDGEENVFNYGSLTTGEEEIEPVYEEIASPFEWQVGLINVDTGELEGDSQTMRIVSTEIIGFTTPAIIDMSEYSSRYAYYLYDIDGNYIECSPGWISSDVPFELTADRTVRFKVCHNNYAVWTNESINTFASAIKVYVEEGGEAYVVETEKNEPDDPVIELGKPIENVLYVIGGSTSTGSAGFGVYENAPRMTALARNGVKPISDINSLCAEEVYFIAIPADATKITVICPDFIPALQYFNYENDAYTRVADPGWTTLGGLEDSFTAGAYSHVAINFKNSGNTTIPADTDTSGFSIMFE